MVEERVLLAQLLTLLSKKQGQIIAKTFQHNYCKKKALWEKIEDGVQTEPTR
jgi:hypothetical protein